MFCFACWNIFLVTKHHRKLFSEKNIMAFKKVNIFPLDVFSFLIRLSSGLETSQKAVFLERQYNFKKN